MVSTLTWVVLFLCCPGALSALVNRTIDDFSGDSVTGALPVYSPSDGWTSGNTCVGCRFNSSIANVSEAFDKTWHDATYYPGQPDRVITLQFTGIAVYAFNLIVNQIQWTTTYTNISFTIDGQLMSVYSHELDSTTNIDFQVPVFSHEGLSNDAHTLEIRATGTNASSVYFDYVAYTVEENDPVSTSVNPQPPPTTSQPQTTVSSPSSSFSTPSAASVYPVSSATGGRPGTDIGPIVGAALGGAAFVAIFVLAFHILRRRRIVRRPARYFGEPRGGLSVTAS